MAQGSKFLNIAGATTTQVKTGRGRLFGIVCNTAVLSGVITIYDNTSTSGTKIGTITNPAALLQNHYQIEYMGLEFNVGLRIVTSAADDITVIYE